MIKNYYSSWWLSSLEIQDYWNRSHLLTLSNEITCCTRIVWILFDSLQYFDRGILVTMLARKFSPRNIIFRSKLNTQSIKIQNIDNFLGNNNNTNANVHLVCTLIFYGCRWEDRHIAVHIQCIPTNYLKL